MVIGEAPGFQEEQQGRPFVGPSGRLLNIALTTLGIRREELYITNVVKEVPRNAEGRIRRPLSSEIAAWVTLLALEITEVAPLAILALGRTAVDQLMGEGTPFGKQEGTYHSAWHPSYVARLMGEDIRVYHDWVDRQLRPWADEVRT